jgi:hypothetical protein
MLMKHNNNLQKLLEQVISLEKADKGNIQLYSQSTNDLKIVAQIGFQESFLKHFNSVKPFDTSACGRAFGIGNPVLINDTEIDIGFKPTGLPQSKLVFGQ